MNKSILSKNYKNTPYWWDLTPRPFHKEIELPKETDVLVIGSGYTGLCSSIQTSRNGIDTVVLDSHAIGWGCSTRNGGQISTSIKPSLRELSKKYGDKKAFEILREGQNALKWIGDFIEEEKIDCDYRMVGGFCGAHSSSQFRFFEKEIKEKPKNLKADEIIISKSEQHKEIGTDFYYGGIIYPYHASIDPAKFHQGLLEKAIESGVKVKDNCEVLEISKEGNIYRITTKCGIIKAREIIVATSGYTKKVTPWHRRRVIPIGSYIIATEVLKESLVDQLIPKDRNITDTRKLVVYYRASPDRKRILFGGRVSLNETDTNRCVEPLHKKLIQIFPQLKTSKVSHSWMGFVGFTFDHMPHTGCHEGIHYSMGYCGSGISLASYFGTKLGQRIAGMSDGGSILTEIKFQTRPLYSGSPWFLAPSILYYRFVDRFLS